ncbi:molybdenum cofactor guanylyltransferase [Sphingorhabdus sp. IMCC26285]|uniref:Molybdenum cofactor guanylyltransferase n=1 Tax=Sphingorhabdus profundilacus TaxID=2509718 RepID=A0A6I4M2L0_9SPHN|nr:molybdenum cofactor guanylyltransferase [Sphingorhabdus profundilacus]MVZ96545.1 molybdenum cofactor guanylyltransferase [Sphingorhabdus profundilacus]
MKILGAILAGGKSTRFGSDKAAAVLNNLPLIENVANALRNQVDELIVCGREWPNMRCITDRPVGDKGPLGGLNAALHFARDGGFDYVFSVGCDVLPIPQMPKMTDPNMACFVEDHFLFGLWPASLAPELDWHLEQQTNYSMRHWIETIGARPLPSQTTYFNINRPSDLIYAADKLAKHS